MTSDLALRFAPMKYWEVNNPAQLERVLGVLNTIKDEFEATGAKVSLADLIVLAGGVGFELAVEAAGKQLEVPFTPGRMDTLIEQTDMNTIAWLEPRYESFRNYVKEGFVMPAEYLLVDRVNLLGLSAPEMTVLVGGLRVLDTNYDRSAKGVLTETLVY